MVSSCGSRWRIEGTLSIESADELLAMAIDGAEHRAGVEWSGQRFVVQGNPVVLAAATSDEATT